LAWVWEEFKFDVLCSVSVCLPTMVVGLDKVMLEGRFISFLCPLKINVAFKIPIGFVIKYY
jgi:hypothetical protein